MTEYEIWNLIIGGCGAIATFLAILVALFGKRIQDWIDRPIIKVYFELTSDRCFRNAIPIRDDIQEFHDIMTKKRQYFRLKVSNDGKSTAKRVRIILDLYYEDMKEAERFEPNPLRWVTSNTEDIDIANKEITYINLLSQVTEIYEPEGPVPQNLFVIRWEIFNMIPRGIAWDRVSRKYIIKLIVHGDNLEAKTYWLQFIPDTRNIFAIGNLQFIKMT